MPQIYLTASGNWTVPNDWNQTNNTIECIGAGAGGLGSGGGGGSGAAYAIFYGATYAQGVYPGASVPFTIGASVGNGASGGDTWMGGATLAAAGTFVGAKGGPVGSTHTGGVGGSAANSLGPVVFNGGPGGNGVVSGTGGGGGGAAGPLGPGWSGGKGVSGTTNGGGGGGGADDSLGSAGTNASGTTGGFGGNGPLGTGGGSDGANGYDGGGGGGSDVFGSGQGGDGIEWTVTGNSGGPAGAGGGGGGGQTVFGPGTGGLYGGGAGGGSAASSGGNSGQGIIVITYNETPPTVYDYAISQNETGYALGKTITTYISIDNNPWTTLFIGGQYATSANGSVIDNVTHHPNLYTLAENGFPNNSSANGNFQVFYSVGVTNAPGTLTFTGGGTTAKTIGTAIGLLGVEGYDSATVAVATGSGTVASVTSGTPTAAGEIFIGIVGTASTAATITQRGGWSTFLGDSWSQVTMQFQAAWLASPTSIGMAPLTYTADLSTSAGWVAMIISFTPSPSIIPSQNIWNPYYNFAQIQAQ